MFRKTATAITAFTLAIAIIVLSFDPADARHGRRNAIIGGIALGALALGTAARANAAGCEAPASITASATMCAAEVIANAAAPSIAINYRSD